MTETKLTASGAKLYRQGSAWETLDERYKRLASITPLPSTRRGEILIETLGERIARISKQQREARRRDRLAAEVLSQMDQAVGTIGLQGTDQPRPRVIRSARARGAVPGYPYGEFLHFERGPHKGRNFDTIMDPVVIRRSSYARGAPPPIVTFSKRAQELIGDF
ncbi:uncharacterized protein LOC124137317 [Haliotis rufescens]|uniref:uncharacterized protein LOC124137317 n=1 Tax=Haliotis rufescens TaxID=6454 RepID=UPI001EAFD8DA|nr:uncharacterized protein LOC124137317 [Haliotis rufescens]